ncbi:MAG: GUN4 domain-containing protein, partial [Spirulina sp.]
VEGIETGAADKDRDGKIYARELHEYAKRKVQEEKPKQKPDIILDGEGYDILLSRASVSDLELDVPTEVELDKTFIDYTLLRDLLAAGQWREADIETYRVMCQVADMTGEKWVRAILTGRQWQEADMTKEKLLSVEDIERFPYEDLRTINQLWLHYSNGKFGFSVQKKIYQSLGGTREYNEKIWKQFCDRVGWRKEGEMFELLSGRAGWLYYKDLTFDLEKAVPAHLPARCFVQRASRRLFSRGRGTQGVKWAASLLSRTDL